MNLEEYHERIEKTHSVTGVPSYWEDLQAMTASRNDAADEIQRLRAAIQKIEQAIVEEGKMPSYHKQVMTRHRMEWGTLHNAIDEAIKAIHNE
jgi:hypothetical protein